MVKIGTLTLVYEFLNQEYTTLYLHNYCYHEKIMMCIPKGDCCGIALSGSAVGGICEVCPEPDVRCGISSSCVVAVGAAPKQCSNCYVATHNIQTKNSYFMQELIIE